VFISPAIDAGDSSLRNHAGSAMSHGGDEFNTEKFFTVSGARGSVLGCSITKMGEARPSTEMTAPR
jgi:hypothetical protein